jgi:hypothetical protein
MANPLVRKHMHFFAEDTGGKLKEAWQANCWKNDVNAEICGPMVCHEGKDFSDMRARIGSKVQCLRVHPTESSLIIDAREACHDLLISSFFASFVEFKADHGYLGWPNPPSIGGMHSFHIHLCLLMVFLP